MRRNRLLFALAIAAPVTLVAGAVGTLTTFSNGEVADATAMNANFAALKSANDDNDARLTTVESRFVAATPLPASATPPAGAFPVGATYFDTTERALRVWDGATWLVIGARIGTASYPAPSASAIKAMLGAPTNGVYHYAINGTTKQLYTDFTTFPSYPMVLVTRLSSADNQQYLTTERNVADLAVANTTAPTRSAKLSDADLNAIIAANTIKWAVVGNKAIFFRHADAWTSNFGTVASCSYTTSYYTAFATPSNAPTWTALGPNPGACGGGQDAAGNWLLLTGIHTNDANYNGGYVGPSTSLGNAPAGYVTATGTSWNQPGYVFLSW